MKKKFLGRLFEYTQDYCAFDNNVLNPRAILIFIGGLGDGFISVPYLEGLSKRLKENHISMLQFLMPSSGSRSFGTSSLDEDSHFIVELLRYINDDNDMECKDEKGESIQEKRVILLGHSTGCQDILWTLTRKFQEISELKTIKIVLAVLQAPASDRDYFLEILSEKETDESLSSQSQFSLALKNSLKWANNLKDSKMDAYYYEEPLFGGRTPVTAYRIKSLLNRLGDDDYFSKDLTIDERRNQLRNLPKSVPIIAYFGEKDECMRRNDISILMNNLKESSNGIIECTMIKEGDHSLRGVEEDFIDSLMKWINDRSFHVRD